MRAKSQVFRGLVGVLALSATVGCQDELPTATGEDRFPPGSTPTTLELVLPAEAFVVSHTQIGGFVDPRSAPFLLVANQFDGELQAHALARFTGFPDSVTFTVDGASRTEADFSYVGGRVQATVDSLPSFRQPTVLRLWALDQAWDSASVTWTEAEAGEGGTVAWRTPGGTRGALLAEALWTPGDTLAKDTVTWTVDSTAVRRMAEADFPGVLVTSETAGARVQLGRLSLTASLRPAARPDTTVEQVVRQGPQTFIFTPAPPQADGVLRVGGLDGERVVARLDLDQEVPACAEPSRPDCPRIPLREATLNRVSILLQPRAVPSGFRPLVNPRLLIRRVLEPELGARAPLGTLLFADTVGAAQFAAPGAAVSITVTAAVRRLLDDGDTDVTVALLTEPEGQRFGYLWFDARPRLRIIYTLPLRPTLP